MNQQIDGLRAQSKVICTALIFYIIAGRLLAAGYRSLADAMIISETVEKLFLLMIYVLSVSLPILVLKNGWQAKSSVSKPKSKTMLQTVWLFFAMYFVVLMLNLISRAIMGVFGLEAESSMPDFPKSTAAAVIFILNYTLFPAVLEEMLFRGIIIERLRPYGDKTAVVVSSLLFAGAHLSAANFAGIFVMSLLFGWLAVKKGSIVPAVIVHLINNVIAALFSWLGANIPRDRYNSALTVLIIVCGIAAAATAVFLISSKRKISLETKLTPGRFFRGVPAAVLLVLIVIMTIERIVV